MSVTAMTPGSDMRVRPMTPAEKKVIFASSLGTVFEWYDFYLYGTLAAFIGAQFFSPLSVTGKTLAALLAFAAGFLVRPLGALVFGPLGDLVGRKYTFLITIVIMGLSTFLVGVLPSYEQIGVIAPIILVGLRMLQGLALGGEYGGAATYVAEHSPHGQRGNYTSWIQTTATLGLALSIAVILITRLWMGDAAFASGRLAHSLHRLGGAGGDLGLDSPAIAGVACVPAHEARGHAVKGAALGSVRQVEQRESRAPRLARRDDGRSRGVVL